MGYGRKRLGGKTCRLRLRARQGGLSPLPFKTGGRHEPAYGPGLTSRPGNLRV